MKDNLREKVLLIGIAGTQTDFLLSLHVLKSFIYQYEDIKNRIDVVIKQYYYIPADNIEEGSEEILSEIEKTNPELVGFSCYTWNIDAIKLISDRLKQRNKDLKIVLGGPEIINDDAAGGRFNNFNADFLIFGEGEKPFLGLCQFLFSLNGKRIEDLRGLAYRKGIQFVCNSGQDFIENLKDLDSPYLSGCVSSDILLRPDIRVNIETQRGCNFRCAYCFYHKNFPKIRYRNADTVIEEFDYVYKKGVKINRILDANFLSDKSFAKKIMVGLIERKIKMSIFFEILPQFLDEEMANLFAEYSKRSADNRITVGIGLQTINRQALIVIRRNIPVQHFERAFGLLRKAGVIIKSDIILGLPRETKETYLKTLEFITEKARYGANYLSLAPLRILPGSDLVEIAKKENLIIDGRDNFHTVYATPTMSRSDMLDCLRLNTAAFRLLSSIDETERMKLRDEYFEVKDTLKITNVELLQYFAREIFEFLKDRDVDYVKPDFPNAEYYSWRNIYSDISNEWLFERLSFLKRNSLVSEIKDSYSLHKSVIGNYKI